MPSIDKVYIDSDFTSGDSPIVLDFETDLSVSLPVGTSNTLSGNDVFFVNKGLGDIGIELSYDGTDYGDLRNIPPQKFFSIGDSGIKKMRLTHTGVDSAYEVSAFPDVGTTSQVGFVTQNNICKQTSQGSVSIANTDTLLLAENSNRKAVLFTNKGNKRIWVSFDGATAVVGEGTLLPSSYGNIELGRAILSIGEVRAISEQGTNSVAYVELE